MTTMLILNTDNNIALLKKLCFNYRFTKYINLIKIQISYSTLDNFVKYANDFGLSTKYIDLNPYLTRINIFGKFNNETISLIHNKLNNCYHLMKKDETITLLLEKDQDHLGFKHCLNFNETFKLVYINSNEINSHILKKLGYELKYGINCGFKYYYNDNVGCGLVLDDDKSNFLFYLGNKYVLINNKDNNSIVSEIELNDEIKDLGFIGSNVKSYRSKLAIRSKTNKSELQVYKIKNNLDLEFLCVKYK